MLDERFCVFNGGWVQVLAAEHTGNFHNVLLGVKDFDLGERFNLIVGLEHPQVMVSMGSHLRQVGNGDYLNGMGDIGHHLTDHACHISAHACVNLVKDDAWQLHVASDDSLDAEHYARDFSSRSRVLDRHGLLVLVECHHEVNGIGTGGCEVCGVELDIKGEVFHA